jgi:hypothetical protein
MAAAAVSALAAGEAQPWNADPVSGPEARYAAPRFFHGADNLVPGYER